LYDPQFTPAMALERMLRSQSGKASMEVIDLARTNQGFALRDLAISAANLLQPDAVVIFAGNNWGPFAELSPLSRADVPFLPLSGTDVPFLDSALRERGVAGLRQL